jgi:hypothetical protein
MADGGSLSDTDVIDLLLWGKFQTNQVASALLDNAHFYQRRKELDKTIQAIGCGKRIVAIHSKLGNGKTLLVEALKVALRERGYGARGFAARE